jgi:hypothetical protein
MKATIIKPKIGSRNSGNRCFDRSREPLGNQSPNDSVVPAQKALLVPGTAGNRFRSHTGTIWFSRRGTSGSGTVPDTERGVAK